MFPPLFVFHKHCSGKCLVSVPVGDFVVDSGRFCLISVPFQYFVESWVVSGSFYHNAFEGKGRSKNLGNVSKK